MEAKKNIKLDLPDEVEIGLVDKIKYNTIESQVAFYNLLIKEGEKYYKRENLWDEKMNRDLIGLLKGEVQSLKEDLERERMNNKPLGFMFSNIVIEIELDMFDTIEEQIEYLKRKIREFDIETINVDSNEYDDIKNKLKQNILSRYSILKNKNCNWDDFIFDGLWNEIVDSHFDPYRINSAIDKVGINKREKFKDFIKESFKRFTIDEWMREYDTKAKLATIEGINKDDRLSEEEKHHKTVNVWEGNFMDSFLGKETLSRLKLFEEKFVKDDITEKRETEKKIKANKLIEEIMELRNKIEGYKKEIREKNLVLNELHKENKVLEKQFGNDVTSFPLSLKDEIKNKREKIINVEKERTKIKYKLWGTFDTEGLIWKHDRLVQDFKRQSIGDQVLFKELDYKSSDRWIGELKKKILKNLKGNGKEVDDDKLDELVLDVLKEHQSDNEEIYEEILNPEMAEQNVQKVINKVLINKKLINKKNGAQKNEPITIGHEVQKTKLRKKINTSNEVIAEEVVNLWDNGTEEFEEIFKKLSEDSESIFKEKLTPGQIKGRYQRYSEKNKDLKRKK